VALKVSSKGKFISHSSSSSSLIKCSSSRYTLTQRQINEKEEEIKQLKKQMAEFVF